MTFLFSLTSVKMEWTRQVFENIAPKAKLKPAINSHARAVHTAEFEDIDRGLNWKESGWRLDWKKKKSVENQIERNQLNLLKVEKKSWNCPLTVWKCSYATQSTVQAQENDAQIRAHTAQDDEIIQMWTGHLDVSVVMETWKQVRSHWRLMCVINESAKKLTVDFDILCWSRGKRLPLWCLKSSNWPKSHRWLDWLGCARWCERFGLSAVIGQPEIFHQIKNL